MTTGAVTTFIRIAVVLHFAGLFGICLYGIHRLWMLGCWLNLRKTHGKCGPPAPEMHAYPCVSVQIPLYNEPRVAARIIDAAAGLDWPTDRLEIQVLDDSDDETRQIVDLRSAYWRKRGISVRVLRRKTREGFKAGALAAGLNRAAGQYIAVFDSDFVPPADYLKRTLPFFSKPEVGMVQTRWGFLNADDSWLTRLQALLLAPHFSIEHQVRCSRGLFFNFNGTAGVWRRKAIISAGGWQSDTLTEDLDLSYRAQLKGWRFVYLDQVEVPSELPVRLADFRSQQARWGTGSIQTARKLLFSLFRSRLPARVKIEAAVHLLSNFCWVLGFLVTLTLFPVLVSRSGIGPWQIIQVDLPLFMFSGGAILFYYLVYGLAARSAAPLMTILLLPAFSIGMAPVLSAAAIRGWKTRGGVFKRTPKYGSCGRSLACSPLNAQPNSFYPMIFSIAFLVYTLMPLHFAWLRHTWPAIPFLCIFPLGFALIALTEIKEMVTSFINGKRRWRIGKNLSRIN